LFPLPQRYNDLLFAKVGRRLRPVPVAIWLHMNMGVMFHRTPGKASACSYLFMLAEHTEYPALNSCNHALSGTEARLKQFPQRAGAIRHG
jgi:hypothetical protein